MKVLYFLLKTGLFLSLPLGFSLAATLIAPSSVQAQTNQSDITGDGGGNSSTIINSNSNIKVTTTIITNQSDSTGGVIGGGGTIIREITVSITRILIDSNLANMTAFLTPTPGGESSATPTPTPTATPTPPPTIEPVSSPEPAPVQESAAPQPTPLPPLPSAQQPGPQQSAPVSTNQSDSTGNTPIPTPGPGAGGPQNPAIQIVELPLGPQRFVMLVPSGNNGRGNGIGTLVALLNLGEQAQGRVRLLASWNWGSWGGMLVRIGNQRVFISLAGISPGSSQNNPVLPGGMANGAFSFVGVVTGAWVDPPIAEGFRYTMNSDSLFTEIQDFPTGFPNPFTVSVNGQELGEFGPGDSVDFTQFPGGGVKEFTITGLTPLVDPENPIAFPLKVGFNTETADFTMGAILDPEAVAFYEENPVGPEPFTFNILSDGGTMEIVPASTSEVLRENADRVAEGISDPGKRQQFLNQVAAVETDLNQLSSKFQSLLPVGGGLNATGLNPSMTSVESLRQSLPLLLEELDNLSDNASESEAMPIANLINEVEGMTSLLEAVTPMLSQMRESLAIAR
ncbi:hypothetical protein [Laspinema olomoucense]|uniref:Uncharacterized protein n=1 Tax=Laspinema olomoucense D3b TaxID=2953688 RepID=A0ABT2NAZ0_9CYAN|nr:MULTISPECIES: hypothetical protein [unclassified Laspinema]MCT7979727.1 hypothetical protein [Laspinema sp. D3b]MCT7989098.1 hypothetical protein [Laspinema sp. D3a]MCT7993428.1 hypothetical protein [Laspinema sp. D3c]